MPFRTRDFLLFLLVVIFLVVAITATVWRDVSGAMTAATIGFSSADEAVVYEAILTESPPDEKGKRLDQMRNKIAKLGDIQTISTPVDEDVVSKDLVADEVIEDKIVVGGVDYCEDYIKVAIDWSPNNLNFEVVEGARIIYRDTDTISTSSTLRSEKTILQLPLRIAPVSVKSCIGEDVVGVALDGSLMRNKEYSLYGIFGSETLLGYALDGFPIYGNAGGVKTDICGGVMESGQYRYYLSSEREGILGCYSGVPVRL